MQARIPRAFALTLCLLITAACGSPNDRGPTDGGGVTMQPTFIRTGTREKLNLPAAAEAKVRFRDPVQGDKRADGSCSFAEMFNKPGAPKPRGGLRFTVGEWDVETCAGVLYYSDKVPHPKPVHVDTLVIPTAASFDPWDACNYNMTYDTLKINMTIYGQTWGQGEYDVPKATTQVEGRVGWNPPNAYRNGCARVDNAIVIRTAFSDYWLPTGGVGIYYDPQRTITLSEYASARAYSTYTGSCGAARYLGIQGGESYPFGTFDIGIKSDGSKRYAWGDPGYGSGFNDCFPPLGRVIYGEFVEGWF